MLLVAQLQLSLLVLKIGVLRGNRCQTLTGLATTQVLVGFKGLAFQAQRHQAAA
ncbi:hypothetical protein D3C78_1884160 [compost metagenome]